MEPILLKNCKGIIGLVNDQPVFLPKTYILYDETGIRYDSIDKSGRVIECGKALVSQTFFNSHTHAAMTLFRNVAEDSDLHGWLASVWQLEARLNEELVRLGSEKALLEFILTGTTGFMDMYFYPIETVDIASKYNVKILTGPTAIGKKYSVGELERQYIDFKNKTQYMKHVKPVIGLHSIYTLSLDFFKELSENPIIDDPYIHIHVSETKEEVFNALREHGQTPVTLLYKTGIITDKTVMVHLGWVTNRELEIIKEKMPWLVHCPSANMKLATGGFFPLLDLVKSNYPRLLLGTDGAASNDSLNMIHEARQALLIARNNYWSTEILPETTLSMAWRGWRLYNERKACISQGCKPDLFIIDLETVLNDKYIDRLVLTPPLYGPWLVLSDGEILFTDENIWDFVNRNNELAEMIKEAIEELIEQQ